jgi:hypothetical protein
LLFHEIPSHLRVNGFAMCIDAGFCGQLCQFAYET